MATIEPEQLPTPVRSVTVTLNNEQIKALPTDHYVIVPATDTPNYSRTPTSIPILLSASITGRGPTGYVCHINSYGVFAYGSDWSINASPFFRVDAASGMFKGTNTDLNTFWNVPGITKFDMATGYVHWDTVKDAFYDNSLTIAANNNGTWAFTGGHADNELVVTVNYTIHIP